MDTVQTTQAQAALGKDTKHLASAADSSSSSKMNSIAEKPQEYQTCLDVTTAVDNDNENKEIRAEETDDLLEKIDEAVKDKSTDLDNIDNDLSQSSEHDFIKKLEEIENDGKEIDIRNRNEKDNESNKECDSEKVVVGKLVMEVSLDNTKTEKNVTKGEYDIEKCNDKVNTSTLPINQLAHVTESLSSTSDEINCTKKEELVQEVEHVHKDKSAEEIEKIIEMDAKQVEAPKICESNLSVEISANESTNSNQVQPSVPSILENVTTSENTIQEKVTETFPEINKGVSKTVNIEENLKTTIEETKRGEGSMSVDLIDPLCEPMDLDSEEKMDVDNEVVDEVNDQEMKPISEIITVDQKSKIMVPEVELMQTKSQSEEIIQEIFKKKIENVELNALTNITQLENKSFKVKESLDVIKSKEGRSSATELDKNQPQLLQKLMSPQKSTELQKCTSAKILSNTSEVGAEFSACNESLVTSKRTEKEKETSLSSV